MANTKKVNPVKFNLELPDNFIDNDIVWQK